MIARYFTAFKEDGQSVYSGYLRDDDDLAFYTEGHPVVYRLEVVTLTETKREDVPVNRDPELVVTWAKRNNR
jgi:hypothetical protein